MFVVRFQGSNNLYYSSTNQPITSLIDEGEFMNSNPYGKFDLQYKKKLGRT